MVRGCANPQEQKEDPVLGASLQLAAAGACAETAPCRQWVRDEPPGARLKAGECGWGNSGGAEYLQLSGREPWQAVMPRRVSCPQQWREK